MAHLSLRGVVRCSGDQNVAADALNEALKLPLSLIDKWRLGYSISVATFADELARMERMDRTYSDQMAVAPVALYDIDLDDFMGMCGNRHVAAHTGRGHWPRVILSVTHRRYAKVDGAAHLPVFLSEPPATRRCVLKQCERISTNFA
ncbi:hypothetical protein HPB50_015862 [Hyalomma asiaticum]|uniref:Uncharacterized protein n=1 Tax=Hyalomma asiaticum TaxID=266040 RepID=A0ACB7T4S9_HYAAI|nr:hypothetical protein HPB50_015862 [Hyalomma asiaticum]